jgi:hypothetical protein
MAPHQQDQPRPGHEEPAADGKQHRGVGTGERQRPWRASGDCEVAASMARRFGLDDEVEAALWAIFERWDGRGGPHGLRGEQIPLAARGLGSQPHPAWEPTRVDHAPAGNR